MILAAEVVLAASGMSISPDGSANQTLVGDLGLTGVRVLTFSRWGYAVKCQSSYSRAEQRVLVGGEWRADACFTIAYLLFETNREGRLLVCCGTSSRVSEWC